MGNSLRHDSRSRCGSAACRWRTAAAAAPRCARDVAADLEGARFAGGVAILIAAPLLLSDVFRCTLLPPLSPPMLHCFQEAIVPRFVPVITTKNPRHLRVLHCNSASHGCHRWATR